MTVDFVTIAHVLKVRERDADGELLDTHAFHRLSAQYVRLYDPPVDGLTPLDGAGEPASSVIGASQALGALDKGFTEEPIVAAKKGK